MDKIEHPPVGTWDVVNRHGKPRYVVEHDGKGGWWGVCQPDRPEDCYVLAASKEMLEVLKELAANISLQTITRIWIQRIVDRAEGR